MKRNGFLVCALLLFWALVVSAREPFRQKLDSPSMLIGDQQHLVLNAEGTPPGDAPFDILDSLEWMQVLDRGSWQSNGTTTERKILFTVFDSGFYLIPPLGFYPGMDSSKPFGQTLYLEVRNPADSLADLRPLKAIETTEQPFRFLYLIILGILILAGMLFVLYHFFRADLFKPVGPRIPEERKIWEWALESLDQLEGEQLYQQGRIKQHYDQLNLILRNYLSKGLDVPALEHTTTEIIGNIRKRSGLFADETKLMTFLRECDLIKFANLVPEVSTHEKWLRFVRELILETRDTSEQLTEQHRVSWAALLGEARARQFEYPYETAPKEWVLMFQEDGAFSEMEMVSRLIQRKRFELPRSWVRLHLAQSGIFNRWHRTILNVSPNPWMQMLVLLFVLPFIAVFLPFILIVGAWKKEAVFARGVFGLSSNNKLIVILTP
ncbi:MAG TPA: hypothetical protein VFX48_01090 [Saprospiraceae bacterium]|nr:hypothetical protein [Saprospiraceae bacterium]